MRLEHESIGMSDLPTAKDINPFGDLDGICAEEHFLGKTLEEAEVLFHTPEIYCEDLMWMGAPAFRFYVFAAINCIKSDADVDFSILLSSLACTFEHLFEFSRADLKSIARLLAAACRNVVDHYERFNVDFQWYGDLRPRYAELELRFLELANNPES